MMKHYTYSRGRARSACALVLLLLFSSIFSNRSQAQGYVQASRLFLSTGADNLTAMVSDPAGNTYMLASVAAANFPVTIPSTPSGGTARSIMIKMAQDGTLLWSRYIPGSPTANSGYGTLAYSNGTLFMIGATTVTDMPVTNGSVNKGMSDIVYGTMNASTGAMISTVYLGGSGADQSGLSLVAENGFAYLSYVTNSTDIAVTTGPAYTSGYDRMVQKLDVNGNVIYSTYTGRASTLAAIASGSDLAVDNGIVALGGLVDASHAFTTTDGSVLKGGQDFAVIKLNADGSRNFSTIYGGTGDENAPGVVVKNGEVYIAGYSTTNNYPVTDGSSFTGQPRLHVVTKFSTTGSRLYSTMVAGNNANSTFTKLVVDNGSIYLTGTGHSSNPQVNVTDGSTGGNYVIRLNAANGQTIYATLYGSLRAFLNSTDTKMTVVDGKVVVFIPGLNGTHPVTTDGSSKLTQGGSYLTVFSPEGKLTFATWKISGLASSGLQHLTAVGNHIFVAGQYTISGSNAIPVTVPISGSVNSTELQWMNFSLCPPMPTQNDIAPLTQSVCAGGFTQALTGNKVAYSSENMPVLYRGTATIPQQEVIARYQWQVATSATGPWTNIAGAAATLQDFSPPALAETRYYRRLVMPPAGCGETVISTSAVSEVIVGTDLSPTITTSVYNTCVGTPVGIEATVTGGALPYTYSWDNGVSSTTNTATVTPATNSVYTLTVIDNNGCGQKGQVVVNAYAANAGPDVSSCAGQPVRIGVAPPAGLAGVTYAWTAATGLDDAAIAQPLATPATATSYSLDMTVPVTGGGTCTTTDNVNVNVVAAPATANFAGPDVAICKGGSTTIGTTPADAGFTYVWSPSNNLSAVTGSQVTFNAGSELINPNPFTYRVTASSGGCSFTDEVSVTELLVNAGEDMCGPRTVGTGDPLPGVTGKTFLWEVVSGPGTITGPDNTPNTTVSASAGAPTTYRLTVTYLGRSCSDVVVVGDCGSGGFCPLKPIEVIAANSCPSTAFGAVSLRAALTTLSTSQWTYSWSAVPAGGLSATTGSVVTLTDNVERDVTVTITSVVNPSYSCSETIHVNGSGWSLPVFTAQDHAVCPGTPVNLGQAPVAGYSYRWNDVAAGDITSSNPSVTPDLTTGFVVKVTDDASGCSVTDTATVIVSRVVVDPGPDWNACASAMVQLGSPARPGYSYSWTPAVASYQDGTDNTSAQPKVLVATTQDFTLRATDTQTGCFKDSTVHIVIDPGTTLPAMANATICRGASAQIGNPGLPNVTYAWSPATGLSSTTVAQPMANPTSTQVYTLVVTYYDAANVATCTKSGSVTVTVNGPAITMSDDAVCPSATNYILSTGVTVTGTAPYTYQWTPTSQVTTPANLNSTVLSNPTSPRTYTLAVRDASGCTVYASKTLSPTNAAPLAGSNSNVCVGNSVTLGNASNTGTITWSVTPGIAGTLSNVNAPAPVFTPVAADAGQNFTFTCSQNIAGCVSTSTVTVYVKQFTLPAIPVKTVCENASTTIGVTPAANVSYSWSPAIGLADPYAATTTVNSVTGTTAYTLTAIDINGCAATTQAVIGVNPVPAPTVTVPDVITNIGVPAQAFNPQINPAAGTYTYVWTPANKVNNAYVANAVPTENRIGNTPYTLSVTDGNGCTSTTQAFLRVQSIDILPVTLASFTATARNCGVTVNWKVETAENFSHFIVERSIADGNWVVVKTVYYEYNRANYNYQDAEPGNGRWNYRLKMVDIDGRFTYSKQASAEVKCNQQSTLRVYPNPVSSYVYVSSSKPVKTVRLLTLTGSLLLTKEINQTSVGAVQIPLTNLIKGVYILQVIAKDGTMQPAKLVKE